jgi:hypothetical protein
MNESTFESILAKYPELIEERLSLLGRQVSLGRKHVDLLFQDRHGQRLIVELKKGPILREHVAQVMDYEGHFLTPDDPTPRVMLIGNRVPENFRRSLDHHGIEWREIPVALLISHLRSAQDQDLLALVAPEDSTAIPTARGRSESQRETPRQHQGERANKPILEIDLGSPPPASMSLEEVKRVLAERHIKDPGEKRIFLEQATQFKSWANYIAALVLDTSGKKQFKAADIKAAITQLMPNHFGRVGAIETGLLTADVEVNQVKYNLGLPCLERINGTHLYRFIGFKIQR